MKVQFVQRKAAVIACLRRYQQDGGSLIAIYVAVALAALVVISVQAVKARTASLQSLHETLESYSKITEEALVARLGRIETVLAHLSRDLERTARVNWDASGPELEFEKTRLKDIKGLALSVIDAEGTLVYSTANGNADQGVNLSQREWFKAVSQDASEHLYISRPLRGKLRDTWLAFFVDRIDASDGSFKGAVLAAVPAEYFVEFRQSTDLASLPLFSLSTGTPTSFLYRFPPRADAIGKEAPYANRMGELKASHRETHIVSSALDNVARMQSISLIGDYQMTITLGKEVSAHLEPWRAETIRQFAIIGLIEVLGFFLVLRYVRSVRSLHRQQAQLAETSKMASLGEMAGGIAHEINNPLAIIKAKADHILEMLESQEPGEALQKEVLARDLLKISQTSDRIARIVRGLRTFARSGEKDPFELQDLEQIVSDTLGLCAERFKNHGCELRVSLKSGFTVSCRPTQISQVLLNLLNNSFDAVRADEAKWISLEVEMLQGAPAARVAVTDSGKGIAPDIAARLMQPFFTTKEVGKGTGLGLSIAKGIIEEHGGRLYLDSACSNTRFIIELPLVAGEAKRTAA